MIELDHTIVLHGRSGEWRSDFHILRVSDVETETIEFMFSIHPKLLAGLISKSGCASQQCRNLRKVTRRSRHEFPEIFLSLQQRDPLILGSVEV